MYTRDEAERLCAKILSYSTLPECEVELTATEEYYTRFANNGITTAGFAERRTAVIRSTRDGKTGKIQTGEMDDRALKASVKRTEDLAAIAPADPERQPPLGRQQYPEIHEFDERTANARAPEMIPQIGALVKIAGSKKLVAAGLFERSHTTTAVANKAGLFGYSRSADSRLSTTIRMPDGSSSGWAGHPSLRIADISGEALANQASEKCLRWRNPKRLDPGAYTVVLEPTAAGDIVRLIARGLDARGTEEGRTFLSRKGGGTLTGETLFPEFVTLRSDPFSSRQSAVPWTSELLPQHPVSWVQNGVAKNTFYTRYWAARTGKSATPFPGALVLDGSEASTEDLIRSVDRGLLVTHFWYIRFVNPQTLQHTGLTRDGVFLIENGKIAEPVMNFRFNDSPVELLKNTKKLGRPERVRGLEGGEMVAPAILASNFHFTSVSDAV